MNNLVTKLRFQPLPTLQSTAVRFRFSRKKREALSKVTGWDRKKRENEIWWAKLRGEKPNLLSFRPQYIKKGNRFIVQDQRQRNLDLRYRAEALNQGWRVVCATILQRYPTINASPKWKEDMEMVQDRIAVKLRASLMDKLRGSPAFDLMPEKDFTWEEIYAQLPFVPAPRVTKADLANDRRTLNRKLDQSLYLIVKRNRTDNAWQFPQGKLNEGEVLRAGSERVIARAVGSGMRSYFFSNGPFGHYLYEYNQAMKEKRGVFGAQVYHLRAQYLGGPVNVTKKLYVDYAWITRDEVYEYFDQETATYFHYLLLD